MLRIPIVGVNLLPVNIVSVNEKVLQQYMYHKSHIILTYTVRYPYFTSDRYQDTLNKLNSYYQTRAYMYVRTEVMNLYKMAMVEYEYAVANDFPIRPFEVITVFKVTYNQNCVLSLYFDKYQYTGGAHGITIRKSDSWNIACSSPIRIKSLFLMTDDVNAFVTEAIVEQIDQEAKTEAEFFPYFEDYEALVINKFNPGNFYLTDKGVIIYFQQYDIAPYSTGIPEFLLPYVIGGAVRPKYC